MNTPIIDTHVHFWDPGQLRYAWLNQVPALNRAFLPEEYRAVTQGINIKSLIFVEADCAQKNDELTWITALAKQDPEIQGIISGIFPDNPKNYPPVTGIRRILQDLPDTYCLKSDFVAGIKKLAEFDLSFDICIRSHQLPFVIQLVEQCPDTRFILDHLGKPDIRKREWKGWESSTRKLSTFSNVFCKISGLVTEADHLNWTVSDLRPYVLHAAESFGEHRILFGSDWPVVNLAGGYTRWLSALNEIFADQSDVFKKSFFYNNAVYCYKLHDTNEVKSNETTASK